MGSPPRDHKANLSRLPFAPVDKLKLSLEDPFSDYQITITTKGPHRRSLNMPNQTATCETTLGTFKLELFTEQMPITAWNFIDLANTGN
jgi:hypothetical protein